MDAASYKVLSIPAAKLPEEYKALIFSKWLRSLRYGNDYFRKTDQGAFYKNYHPYIENLMKKPDSLVRLAVLTDNLDVVLGFAVSREDVLDYLYVNKDFRRIGVGTKLIPAGTTTFTHLTKTALMILSVSEDKKFQFRDMKLTFNPFA